MAFTRIFDFGKVNCQPLCKIGNGCFSGTVCRRFTQRLNGTHRTDVDDVSAFLFCHTFTKNFDGINTSKKIQVCSVTKII